MGGRNLPTFFNRFGGAPSELFEELCEPFGGLDFSEQEALPQELANGQAVLGVEEGCAVANLAGCEPLIGSAAVVNRRGDKLTCVNPIGEPVDPNLGSFGQACRANGTCAGDMECNGSNICVESCFSDFDCGSCNFDNGPDACTCGGNGFCQVGGGGGGNNGPGDGQIRLVGGSNAREGRVEITFGGVFGTVCDDNFNVAAAQVVCRQLGFTGGTPQTNATPFGQGSGPIHLDGFTCSGSESRLDQCPNPGIGVNDCSHAEDAGVICN